MKLDTSTQRLSVRVVLFVISCFSVAGSDGPLNITSHPGQNITLPCQTSSNKPLIAVEWAKRGLPSPVFFYKEGRVEVKHQCRSYVGRVHLVDGEMKDGNLALTMTHVSSSDAGTYECLVKEEEEEGKRRLRAVIDSEPVAVVNLIVEHSDWSAGNKSDGTMKGRFGLLAGLLVLALFFALFVLS